MTKQRRFFLMLLLALTVMTLSVCARRQGGADGRPEIRVLLANHPYGELLRAAIPEFEAETGIRVMVESLQEGQLTQRLTTEFATRSSTADVFMTRPLQETLLFNKNGWYMPLHAYDFSDYPANTVDIGRMNGAPHIVPLVTEWQVLYYRRDLLEQAGLSVPTNFEELEFAARALTADGVAGFGSRGAGAAAVTQISSFIYNFGGRFLENNVSVFDSPEALEAFEFYGRLLGNYGPQGIAAMSWEALMPVFQAGRLAMWTDASVFYSQLVDPARTQVPAENIGIARLPYGPVADNPFIVVSWAMGIAESARNPDEAMQFLNWATSREMALRAMELNITMARYSAWQNPAIRAVMHPGLIETQEHAVENGYPFDRPFMSSVGQARNLIGEVIIESINTSGESPRLAALAADRNEAVNVLLRTDGEYGGN